MHCTSMAAFHRSSQTHSYSCVLINRFYTVATNTICTKLNHCPVIDSPQIPYPPDPDVYVGNYTCIMYSEITANIYSKNDVLLVDLSLTDGTNKYYFTATLKYYQALELQVYLDPSQMNCLDGEILALNDSWLYFEKANSSGKSTGFFFPWLQCRMIRNA